MPIFRPRAPIVQLSVAEKVLIHLSRVRMDRESDTAPREICQEGIAEAVGMLRSHVPRAVRDLISEGLAAEGKKHIEDGEKRVKVYLITPKGLALAKQMDEDFLSQIVTAKVQNTMVQGMSIAQLEASFHRRIDILRLSGDEEYVDLDSVATTGVTDFSDSPRPRLFLDREESLEQMKRFLKSRTMILIAYGAKGIGTSSLVKHFIEMLDEWNVLWISLSKYRTVESIKERISAFSKLLGSDSDMVLESPTGSNTLIVMDGYFDVEEPVVGYFSGLAERRNGAKIIITCRDSTPSYNRFYRREHVDSCIVQEMTLKGLQEKDAEILLSNENIPDEAFKRVYALSRGSPMVLVMLKEGDEEGLRRNTTFTNEEIRFLLIEARTKQ